MSDIGSYPFLTLSYEKWGPRWDFRRVLLFGATLHASEYRQNVR